MIFDNHALMTSTTPRLCGSPLHRLLLCGLVLFSLSACSHAVQPWVVPESSQELKQLKVDNYLLKQELALYRKKLMQANLESRRLAEKLQHPGQQSDAGSSVGEPVVQRHQVSGMTSSSAPAPSVAPVRSAPAPAISQSAPQPPAPAYPPEAQDKQVSKPVASAPAPKPAAPQAKATPPTATASPAPAKPAEPQATEPVTKAVAAPAVKISESAAPAKQADNAQPAGNWKTVMTLYFDSGQRFTSPEMRKQLRKFANSLSPTARIRVAGHTDSRTILQSSDAVAENKAMSSERAWSVVRGLKAYGISAKRMQVGAFGATRPVADNGTLEGRAKNSRVDILISE